VARSAAALVREAQPNGPYHLFGHSLGGTVAHELAADLEAAGEQVAFVWMLDATGGIQRGPSGARAAWNAAFGPASHGVDPVKLDTLYTFHLSFDERLFSAVRDRYLSSASDPAELRVVCDRLDGDEDQRLRSVFEWARETGMLPATISFQTAADRMRQTDRLLGLLEGHQPRIVRARLIVGGVTQDPLGAANWRDHAGGGYEDILIEGNHLSCLASPGVEQVAQHLRDCLDRGILGTPVRARRQGEAASGRRPVASPGPGRSTSATNADEPTRR
jgi:thioesterase domain-containing protein